MLEEMYYI